MAFKTLFELMEALRSEPEKYIRVRSVKRLSGFLDGYLPITLVAGEFKEWLGERVAQMPMSPHHWSYFLRLDAGDDRTAFDRFWKYWAEFASCRDDVAFPEKRSSSAEFIGLFGILAEIRQRPDMYLGRATCDRLWSLVAGQRQYWLERGRWDNQGIVYDNFDRWILEGRAARFGLDWSQALFCDYGDDPHLECFWSCWDKYIAELRVWSRRSEYHSLLGAVAGGLLPKDEGQATLHSLWKADHDTTTVPPGLCESASPSSRTFYEEVGWLSSKPLAAIYWLTIEDFAKALSRIDRPAAEGRRESNTEDM